MKLQPVFLVSCDAMVPHAALGMNQRATAEMVNKWVLVPQIMHILTANRDHKYLIGVTKDKKLRRLVDYLMRHHVHDYSTSNLAAHACMQVT